jgi:ammonium transporter Rh
MRWLIEGMFASGTFLISMGALIGKVDLIQLFFIAFWEVVFYAINFFIVGLEFKTMDAGGSMVIHTFGGLFGLAVSWVMAPPSKQPSEDNRSRYGSDITSFIGTVFLMLFWPSFNAFPTGNRQNRAIINTVFSLASSTIATFVVSKLFRPHRKFDMIDICNATLAGGVAVGSTCDFMIGPGGAMVIGTVAGSMSTLMFVYCQPFLERTIKLNDTCGIQALHAAPGMLGGLASIFAALRAADNQGLYDGQFSATFPRGTSQARYQTAALFVTIGISLFSGLLVGFVTKFVTKKRTVSEEMRYRDDLEWETPVGEYALIPQMEELEKLMAARKVE